jgi:hypothetical protein
VLLSVSPRVVPLHIPLCLLGSMLQRDTAGNRGAGQSLDNYLTVAGKRFPPHSPAERPPGMFRRGTGPDEDSDVYGHAYVWL